MNHLLQSFSWIENLLALRSLCKIHVVQGKYLKSVIQKSFLLNKMLIYTN